jgi:hypothetical protein
VPERQVPQRPHDGELLEPFESGLLGANNRIRSSNSSVPSYHQLVPQRVPRQVDDGLPQVGEGLVRIPQPVVPGSHPQVGVMHDVFGGVQVIEQHSGQPDQGCVLAGEHLSQRVHALHLS